MQVAGLGWAGRPCQLLQLIGFATLGMCLANKSAKLRMLMLSGTGVMALPSRAYGSRQAALGAPVGLQRQTYRPTNITTFSGFRRANAVDGAGRRREVDSLEAAVQRRGPCRRGPKATTRAMFERFTEKAIKVVMLAQEEARRLGHNFVGTEQILLGLIGESTGIAAKVLKSMNVNLKDARVEVEKIIGRGSGFVAVEIPFTPRAKRVLELSLEEARQLGAEGSCCSIPPPRPVPLQALYVYLHTCRS